MLFFACTHVAEDSDSSSSTSSDETVGRSKGMTPSGQQKRQHRKKQRAAIPVATPKVPMLPLPARNAPSTPQGATPQERITPPEDRGEQKYFLGEADMFN